MANPQGWRDEALQHRANYEISCLQVQDFVNLFELALPDVKTGKATSGLPLICLAMHHLAMRFHATTGIKCLRTMQAAELQDLPKSFFAFASPESQPQESAVAHG